MDFWGNLFGSQQGGGLLGFDTGLNKGGDISSGILGALPQMAQQPQQPSLASTPPATPNRVLDRPEIVEALGRMGSAILTANGEGKGFSGALGAGTQAFFDTPDKLAQRDQTRAQTGLLGAQTGAQAAQLRRLQLGMSNGETPEAAAYNSRMMFHMQQGDDLATAQAKAYNEVAIKPQVTPGGAIVQPNAIPLPGGDRQGVSLPGIAPTDGSPSFLPAPSAGGDGGMLLPPTQKAGVPGDAAIFSGLNSIQQANAANKAGENYSGAASTNLANTAFPEKGDDPVQALTAAEGSIDQALRYNEKAPGGYFSGANRVQGRLLGDDTLSPNDKEGRNALNNLDQARNQLVLNLSKGAFSGGRFTNMMLQQVQSAKGFDTSGTKDERASQLNQLKDYVGMMKDFEGMKQRNALAGKSTTDDDYAKIVRKYGYDPNSMTKQGNLTGLTQLPAGYKDLGNGQVQGPDGKLYKKVSR